MSKTGGGPGTNQYQVRGVGKSAAISRHPSTNPLGWAARDLNPACAWRPPTRL